MKNDLLESKQKIEKRINEILDEKINENDNKFIKESLMELKRLSQDGKRVRGYLIKLGQELYDKEDDSYIDVAAAIEIFQTAILIHDDIIDKAEKRRNEITINSKYPGHMGLSKAICIGDLGFFIAYDIISNLNIDDSIKVEIMKAYSQTLYNTVIGEIIDVELPAESKDYHINMDGKIIYDIYVNKTAWYTIIGPLLIGAYLSGKKVEKEKIIELGINLGIAFQIKDDLLGLDLNSNKMGKTLNDIKEGKQTIIYKYAINKFDEEDINYIKKYYGNEKITMAQNKKIIKIFDKVGARSYANDLVQKYTDKAIDIISTLNSNNKEKLIELSKYLLKREK